MQISRNIDAWYLHSDSFIRTLTVGTESHQFSLSDAKGRGLYHQWRISLRPETDL